MRLTVSSFYIETTCFTFDRLDSFEISVKITPFGT
jgi:hypothetical protein